MDRQTLTKEIAEVLELPYRWRKGKAHDITNAVLKAIRVGLERDGRVRIDGFGIFTLRVRQPRRWRCYYAPYRGTELHMTKGGAFEIQTFPEKTYVHFQPSTTITKVLNER